jgi:hypothetical protein
MDSSRSVGSDSGLGIRGRTSSFSSITEAFPLLRTVGSDNTKKENEKLWSLMSSYLASGPSYFDLTINYPFLREITLFLFADVHTIQRSIANHVEYTLASSRFDFDQLKAYLATAHSVRDRLIESWNDTNQYFEELQASLSLVSLCSLRTEAHLSLSRFLALFGCCCR